MIDFFDKLPDYDIELYTNKKAKTNEQVSLDMLNAAYPVLEKLSDWTILKSRTIWYFSYNLEGKALTLSLDTMSRLNMAFSRGMFPSIQLINLRTLSSPC